MALSREHHLLFRLIVGSQQLPKIPRFTTSRLIDRLLLFLFSHNVYPGYFFSLNYIAATLNKEKNLKKKNKLQERSRSCYTLLYIYINSFSVASRPEASKSSSSHVKIYKNWKDKKNIMRTKYTLVTAHVWINHQISWPLKF